MPSRLKEPREEIHVQCSKVIENGILNPLPELFHLPTLPSLPDTKRCGCQLDPSFPCGPARSLSCSGELNGKPEARSCGQPLRRDPGNAPLMKAMPSNPEEGSPGSRGRPRSARSAENT